MLYLLLPNLMSLAEQVHLFKNKEIIVGTIGSGLTNIIFYSSGVTIFELNQTDDAIWNLSYLLGLNNNHCVSQQIVIDERESEYDTTVSPLLLQSILLHAIE